MTAATLVGSAGGNGGSASASSCSVSLAGFQAGDLCLVIGTVERSLLPTVAFPTAGYVSSQSPTNTNLSTEMGYKFLTATDVAGSMTVNVSSVRRISGAVIVYRNAGTPVFTHNTVASGLSFTCPSVTPTVADSVLVAMMAAETPVATFQKTFTSGGAYTEQQESGSTSTSSGNAYSYFADQTLSGGAGVSQSGDPIAASGTGSAAAFVSTAVVPPAFVNATGSLALVGSATLTPGIPAAGAIALAGTATAAAAPIAATGTGAITLAGTATAAAAPIAATGTGSIALAGSATLAGGSSTATGTGAIALAGTATVAPGPTTATGSIALAGTATIRAAATAAGAISLAGTATMRAAATAVGSLNISGAATFLAATIRAATAKLGLGALGAVIRAATSALYSPQQISTRTAGVWVPGLPNYAQSVKPFELVTLHAGTWTQISGPPVTLVSNTFEAPAEPGGAVLVFTDGPHSETVTVSAWNFFYFATGGMKGVRPIKF